MRVGVDSFTLHSLQLDPFQILDYARANDLAGVQFGGIGNDIGKMREIRAHADALGLYSHISVSSPNPHVGATSADELRAEIQRASECGWRELHSILGNEVDRYQSTISWSQQLSDSIAAIRNLRPQLRDHGCRINLEPHGDTTTFELVHVVEDVGQDIAGVCLDTANVLCFAEDPVAAARRVAPYTHLTHSKDAIVYFCDKGVRRQVRPPGQGVLDWEKILAALGEFSPDLPLSIEDHKWLYDIEIFTESWHEEQADLSGKELAEFVRLAWQCQSKIHSGYLCDPQEYEALPFVDQLTVRLHAGRDYLRQLAKNKEY